MSRVIRSSQALVELLHKERRLLVRNGPEEFAGGGEVLAEMFPRGAVEADNFSALLDKTRTFLRARPPVEKCEAFSLQKSMEDTLELYHTALKEDRP